MKPECDIEGCSKPTHVRGWCKTHYSRWKRLGDANAIVTRWTHQAKTCSVDGCDRKPNARNLCTSHYNRWLYTGSTDMAPERVVKPCSVDGCEEPNKGRGLCSKHYERWRRYGDPLHVDLKSLTPAKPKAKPAPAPAPARCKTRGCNGEPIARRLCNKHYKQWRKRFKPKPRPKPEPKPVAPPVDVPDHLAAYLERRRKRQEALGGPRKPMVALTPTTTLRGAPRAHSDRSERMNR